MPSSLVFAALALAWIVVLVPMVARRRHEVRRTADSALAARVLRRGDAPPARVRPPEEVPHMPESDPEFAPEFDADGYDDDHWDDHGDDHDGGQSSDGYDREYDGGPARERPHRSYRPGRGGFDPHAAELAAQAKYAFRQRVVLFLLLTALASGLLAGFAMPVLWWLHGAIDLTLVLYLTYLRRQVRIEQEIRQRRLNRAARARHAAAHRAALDPAAHSPGPPDRAAPPAGRTGPGDRAAPRHTGHAIPAGRALPAAGTDRSAAPARTDHADPAGEPVPAEPPQPYFLQRPIPPPGTLVVELDDEDPALHDLDGDTPTPYRYAVGE